MDLKWKQAVERMRSGRIRILWLVLGAMLLVSALPIGLYHRQVLQLSQEKLVDTERVQQSELTRSLAQEVQLFDSNLTQQLFEPATNPGAGRRNFGRGRPAAEPKSHAAPRKLCGEQPLDGSLHDRGRQEWKRHERFAGKFSRGAGPVRKQSALESAGDLPAIAAAQHCKVSQRSFGAGAKTTSPRL